MTLLTGERAFHLAQLGFEVTPGTGVDPDTLLRGESGAIIDLDRSPAEPQEDHGGLARHQPGRGSYGVKLATMPFRQVVRFEDLDLLLRPGFAGGVSASGIDPYTRLFEADYDADTLEPVTIEEGDNIQAYRMTYGLVRDYRFRFNELAAPGNAPWMVEATFIGQDKTAVTLAAGATAVAAPETAYGHLTTIALGSTATAFASLSAEAGLLAADIAIPTGVTPRKWGGSTDTFDAHGRQVREPTGTLTVLQKANMKTALFDGYVVGGATMGEKRCRIECSGSNSKKFIIDGRLRYKAVPVQESNGATLYAASVEFVYDSTLGTDVAITTVNHVVDPA